jgi:L-fuconolactonase
MKIDSHQHFWQYDPVTHSWITDEMSLLKRDFLPEELNLELGTNDVDASITVQADHSEAETLFLLGLRAVPQHCRRARLARHNG